MELNLKRTEYNLDCNGKEAKAVLGFQDGVAVVQLFLEGHLVYYYRVEEFQELILDDFLLIKEVAKHLREDRSRWVKDCTWIEDNYKKCRLIDKVVVYTARVEEFEYKLRLSVQDKGTYYIFRIEYSNDRNDDTIVCHAEAKSYSELFDKCQLYVKTISEIVGIFTVNQEEFMKNAFSKGFRYTFNKGVTSNEE